ncbi:MAG: hypothetical protein ACLT33_13570 [Lachnospira pectinoschiza]
MARERSFILRDGLRNNSIVYIFILVVMALGLLFVLRTVISMHNSNKNADNASQEETTGETDSSETDTQTRQLQRTSRIISE